MFFIPIGIFVGTPGLSTSLYIWKGIIPSGLGNIVGGMLMVGAYYWWMYLFLEPAVAVDGVHFAQPANVTWSFGRKQVTDGDVEAAQSTGANTPNTKGEGDRLEGNVLGG